MKANEEIQSIIFTRKYLKNKAIPIKSERVMKIMQKIFA